MNCSEFLADVVAKQNSATGCNIELPQSKQCQEMVEGLCCPIAVTDMNSPEVLAYLQALQAYLNAGCMAMCPPDPCPQNPQQSCVAQMGSLGNCVVSP